MLHQDLVQLAERFERLELHAAHSGRETLRVLRSICAASRQDTLSGLVEEMHENIGFLLGSLPPYAPPLNKINQVLLTLEAAQASGASVADARSEVDRLDEGTSGPRSNHEQIARHLLSVIPQDPILYTHTLSETVLGVLLQLHQLRRISLVIVTESRPNNDGWVTARRLAEHDVKVQLTIDAAMPAAAEAAGLMLSGAEIINPDGSVVGKIGARVAATFCELQGKPVYIVADSSKINPIPWQALRLSKFGAGALGLDFTHPALEVVGSYFDVTPARLIWAYATETGLIGAAEIRALAAGTRVSTWLAKQIKSGPRHNSPVFIKDAHI